MIEIYGAKGNRKETLYTIVNYDLYQDKDSDKVTEKKQLGNSLETEKQQSLETNKNVKNDKKGKEKNTKKETYFPNDEKLNQTFLDFMDMRNSLKNGAMTERAITMMVNKINKLDNDTAIKMLEQSITNNWKDIYPLKEDDKKPKSTNKFNNFPQREYTSQQMSDIERKLINKGL
jgi:hypothetical protein